MTWRVQKDDPIEKCEVAQGLELFWVVSKSDNHPLLGYHIAGSIFLVDDESIELDAALELKPHQITHWQLIPTPAMPSKRRKKETI